MKKKFICASREYSTYQKPVHAPYLRRSFELKAAPERAELSICGLGFYRLFVNGKDITKGHIAPYISNPDHYCYYDSYDIRENLVIGENVIGVILGNGMMNSIGGEEWDFQLGDCTGAPRLAIELSINANGEELLIEADEEFLTHPSPILFDDFRMGHIYDARYEIDGWCEAGLDTTDWTSAIFADTPRGVLKKCEAEPIRVLREIAPVSIRREGEGYLFDFGYNTAGVCRLNIKGERGQKITMKHVEILNEGKPYIYNIICQGKAKYLCEQYYQTETFTCSGGEDTYIPPFCYYGFRYVFVEGITEKQARESMLTYLVMSSDVRSIGGFECSDERINRLYKMTDNANRSNLFYIPTDCPHREKNGWTGDASMSAEQMLLQYDLTNIYREWLHNIRAAQNARGELPGIVPTFGWGFEWGNGPAWDSVLFNLPYLLYKWRANTDVIRENAHAMIRYLEYVISRRSPDGTVAIGLGDWVPAGKNSGEYDAPLAVTDSIMVMDMARKAAEMLSAVGNSHGAAYAHSIYKDMRDTIRRRLVDFDTMLVKGECQSSQSMAIYYGVFDESEREAASRQLVRLVEAKDNHFDSGYLGMHCVFHVLAECGEGELAFRMITSDTFPSYTLLIDEGYDGLPEHFRIYDGPYGESQNHHFLGDISRFFTMWIAGLNVIDDKTVRLTPSTMGGRITHASAYYELPSGRVEVSWRLDGEGKINLSFSAPDGVNIIE